MKWKDAKGYPYWKVSAHNKAPHNRFKFEIYVYFQNFQTLSQPAHS